MVPVGVAVIYAVSWYACLNENMIECWLEKKLSTSTFEAEKLIGENFKKKRTHARIQIYHNYIDICIWSVYSSDQCPMVLEKETTHASCLTNATHDSNRFCLVSSLIRLRKEHTNGTEVEENIVRYTGNDDPAADAAEGFNRLRTKDKIKREMHTNTQYTHQTHRW
jgi:hypothetical protein